MKLILDADKLYNFLKANGIAADAPVVTPPVVTPPPPPPPPVPIPTAGKVVTHTSGRSYVPSGTVRAALLFGRNGAEWTALEDWGVAQPNWLNSAPDESIKWRDWADKERVALIGLYDGGSVQTSANFTAVLNELTSSISNVTTLKWLIRGFSFSGMRAWNIVTQTPGKVLAFSWDSGDPLQDTWSRTWDGISVPPVSALWAEYQGKWNSFYTPGVAALAVPGLLTIGGAEDLYRKSMVYMQKLGAGNHATLVEIPGRSHTYADNGVKERDFFSKALAGTLGIPTPTPVPTPTPTPTPTVGRAALTPIRLRIDGVNIIDLRTNTRFAGKGVNIPGTDGCGACTTVPFEASFTEWKRRIDLLKSWGANMIRLTLESYTHVGDAGIIRMVDYAGTKDLVCLLTLFSDPSFNALGHPTDATLPTYRKMAALAKDAGHVILGLCNEPQMNYDGASTPALRDIFNKAIVAIRSEGYNGLIAVQGHGGWARLLGDWAQVPFSDKSVIYETHVYSGMGSFQDQVWQYVSKLPLFIGEFGPMNVGANMTLADCATLISQAVEKQVPYLGWTFHHRCGGGAGGTAVESGDSSMLINVAGCGQNAILKPSAWGQLMWDKLLTVS